MHASSSHKGIDLYSEFFDECFSLLKKGFKKYGPSEFLKNLRLMTSDMAKNNEHDYVVEHILDKVVEAWAEHRITKSDLFETDKRGQVTVARKMAIVLISQHVPIADSDLAKFFNRNARQLVFKTLKEFQDMAQSPKVAECAKFLALHKKLDAKVVQYKTEIKNILNGE